MGSRTSTITMAAAMAFVCAAVFPIGASLAGDSGGAPTVALSSAVAPSPSVVPSSSVAPKEEKSSCGDRDVGDLKTKVDDLTKKVQALDSREPSGPVLATICFVCLVVAWSLRTRDQLDKEIKLKESEARMAEAQHAAGREWAALLLKTLSASGDKKPDELLRALQTVGDSMVKTGEAITKGAKEMAGGFNQVASSMKPAPSAPDSAA